MAKKTNVIRHLNLLSLPISIFVFGTGMVLFTQFHIEDRVHQKALSANF